uniref:4-coumarate--CoA ligase n=1 Tax=Oryza brachyantha TaxID=4533 RepID=J3MQB0_ORYBR
MLLLPNSVVFPVSFLAVLAAGGVATTVNPSSSPKEIAAQARATGASLVLASRDGARKLLSPLAAPVVLVPEILDLSVGAAAEDEDQRAFAEFRALLDDDSESAEIATVVGQDDAAAILFSSGTTGRSKGVVLTHRNLIAMVELFVRFEASQYARGARENVYLAALPMFHVYGLSLFAVGLLSLGTTVVVMRRFDVREAVRAIGRYRVTHLPLVPPIMAAMGGGRRPSAAGGGGLPGAGLLRRRADKGHAHPRIPSGLPPSRFHSGLWHDRIYCRWNSRFQH